MHLKRHNKDYKNLQFCTCPDKVGRFQLYSDTSKYATGSALYQIQNGNPILITYASKRLPEGSMKLFYHIVGNVWVGNNLLLVLCIY